MGIFDRLGRIITAQQEREEQVVRAIETMDARDFEILNNEDWKKFFDELDAGNAAALESVIPVFETNAATGIGRDMQLIGDVANDIVDIERFTPKGPLESLPEMPDTPAGHEPFDAIYGMAGLMFEKDR